MATVKNIKDSDFLEVVRQYTPGDPLIYDVLNRPLVDMRQRTLDLEHHFTPYRGFRVRGEDPASTSIEVERGMYMVFGLGPNLWECAEYAGATLGPIAAAAGGKYRVDLVAFDRDTGTAVVYGGVEAASLPLAFASRATATLETEVSLAYIYVDDALAAGISEYIALNTPGCIQDIRQGAGCERIPFATSTAFLLAAGVADVGSNYETVRSNHAHPLNLNDANVPTEEETVTVVAAGANLDYSRSDHIHAAPTTGVTADVKKDSTAAGLVGTSDFFAKGTHKHPSNTSNTVPTAMSLLSAAAGSADYYSRSGHRHALSGCKFLTARYTFTWVNTNTATNTGALPGTPLACFVVGALLPSSGDTRNPAHTTGIIVRDENLGVPVASCMVGSGYFHLGTHVDWTVTVPSSIDVITSPFHAVGGTGTTNALYTYTFASRITCSQFTSAGIILTPSVNVYGSISLCVWFQI